MRRSVWWIGGIVVALLLVAAALAAFAHRCRAHRAGWEGCGPGMRPHGMMRGMGMWGGISMYGSGSGMLAGRLFALDLTSDQATRIRDVMENAQKQAISKQADIRVKRIELGDLLRQAQPNTAQIEAKVADISTTQKDVELIHVRAMLQARGVLTPAQLQRFLDPTWNPAGGQMPGCQGRGPAPGPVHRGR